MCIRDRLPGLVQDFLDRTECIRCPEKDGLQLHGCSTKKTLPGGGTPGMAAPRKGMDGPPAARLGMRRPSGSGHVRRQAAPAGLGGPARGGRPCPKVPLRDGPLSAPQGCRACATRERAPGIFPKSKAYRTHQRGRGSSPSHQAGDGRAAGTPSARIQPPPRAGNGCKPTFPAFSGKSAAHAGNGPPAGSHWRGRPPHRNGAGSAGGIR